MTETLLFAIYLTGHDEATIKQMYEDWKQSKHMWAAPKLDKSRKYVQPALDSAVVEIGAMSDETFEKKCEELAEWIKSKNNVQPSK